MTTKKRTTINFNISVNFNLRNTTPKSKLTTVRTIVRFNNEKVVLPSYFSVKPNDWNDKKQKAKESIMYDEEAGITINDRIKSLTSKIESVFNAYTDKHSKFPEPDAFKTLLVNELNRSEESTERAPAKDLITFTGQFIRDSETGLRLSDRGTPISKNSIKIYNTFKKNLEDFKKKKGYDVSLDNMGLEFFEDFKEYMVTDRKYNTNTVAKHIRTIKTIINDARDRGLTAATFSGKRYRAITEETDSIYLTETELDALYDLDLTDNQRLDRVRDLFLVGCYTGLRFSDFTNIASGNIIEGSKGRFIDIEMQKTGNSVAIPILPVVEAIMEKYKDRTDNSLPPDISNQKMNQYLKEIGEIAASNDRIKKRYPKAAFNDDIEQQQTKAGMRAVTHTPKYKLISSHTARRSFATNAYHRGVPVLSIMSITGHRTETSFMKYIKVTPMEHAEIVMDILRRPVLRVENM